MKSKIFNLGANLGLAQGFAFMQKSLYFLS